MAVKNKQTSAPAGLGNLAGKREAMPGGIENIRKDSHLTDSLTGVLAGDDDPEKAKEDALKEKYGVIANFQRR